MQNEDQVGTYEQAEAVARKLDAKDQDIAEGFKRSAIVAGHDRAASTGLLSNPKGKLNRGIRKMLMLARSYIIRPVESVNTVAIAAPVKFARKLTTLKLRQLVRQQKKFAREASTAKHLIAKMSPGPSRLKSVMQNRHDEFIACFNQVSAEIKARALACEGRLAATE